MPQNGEIISIQRFIEQKTDSEKSVSYGLFYLKLLSNNAYALLVVTVALELYNATLESEKGVVRADTNVRAGMHIRASLANDDVACENGLAVRFLNAKSLRTAIAAVLGRTYTFFMCKKLQAKSQQTRDTSVF